MIRISLMLLLCLAGGLSARADTYRWTDDKGVVSFSDDPLQIPPKYRSKATRSEDITVRNPKVQQELKEQEERARQEQLRRPRIMPTPDYRPPPEPVVVAPPKPASDELPPGRPKSQRIRENVERRQAEERARSMERK